KNKYSEIKSEQIGHQKIHSLLDNGLLVDNEDEINKKFLTAPFSLDEIHKVDFWDIIKKDLWNIENQFGFTVFSRKKLIAGLIPHIIKNGFGKRLLWNGGSNKNKYHLVKWDTLIDQMALEAGERRWSIAKTEKWRLEMVMRLVFGWTNGVGMNLFISVNKALRDSCNSLIFRRRLFGVGANLKSEKKELCFGLYGKLETIRVLDELSIHTQLMYVAFFNLKTQFNMFLIVMQISIIYMKGTVGKRFGMYPDRFHLYRGLSRL
ncbi:hypothetical protein ACJX0J_008364, partial [Zea mays]